MKATIEVDFPTPALAKAAERALEKALEKSASRAELRAGVEKSLLRIEVLAPDFTALRARTTSAFRDLKVISDAMKLKEKENRG